MFVAATLRRSRLSLGGCVTWKKKKVGQWESDRVYALTTTWRPKDIPSARNYGSHAERGLTKRLRGCRRDVAKVLTELSAGGGSITRRESRQNFPARAGSSSVSTPSRMYRKAFADENGLYPGVEWRRHVPPVRSNLRHHPVAAALYPFTWPSLSQPFPRTAMCFSGVLTVGELVAVNNIVTVNFAWRNSI